MTEISDPVRFSHVTDWVFDLDNTLYPHHSNLFAQVDVKITAYVQELLQLPREAARKLQKDYYLEYGTTLNGLMALHQIDPDDFLQKVHDIDYSRLVPDPVLGFEIRALPGRKFIFTNGDRGHAERTDRLRLAAPDPGTGGRRRWLGGAGGEQGDGQQRKAAHEGCNAARRRRFPEPAGAGKSDGAPPPGLPRPAVRHGRRGRFSGCRRRPRPEACAVPNPG